MTVGVITITHNGIGEAICIAAQSILSDSSVPLRHFSFSPEDSTEAMLEALTRAVGELDQGDGIAILTDLYGATPCNIACRLRSGYPVRILAGMSLPMVLRLLTYARLDLDQAIQRATEGAHFGIIECCPSD